MSDHQVRASADDAYEYGDAPGPVVTSDILNCSSHTTPAQRGCGGFRFTGIAIPQGATIESATLEIYCYSASFDDANVLVYAEKVLDAAAFTTDPGDVWDRSPTTATVSWVEDGLGVGWSFSPDIKAVIEEIVGQGSWSPGNDIVVLIKGKSDTSKFFFPRAWDYGDHSYGAKLHITFATDWWPHKRKKAHLVATIRDEENLWGDPLLV